MFLLHRPSPQVIASPSFFQARAQATARRPAAYPAPPGASGGCIALIVSSRAGDRSRRRRHEGSMRPRRCGCGRGSRTGPGRSVRRSPRRFGGRRPRRRAACATRGGGFDHGCGCTAPCDSDLHLQPVTLAGQHLRLQGRRPRARQARFSGEVLLLLDERPARCRRAPAEPSPR